MVFGNWIITEDSIHWNDNGFSRFVIPADQLIVVKLTRQGPLYEWILKATSEEWLTQNDLYDLNYAFVYAAAKYGLNFNYDIFDATLAEQYELFDAEDDEDDI